MTLLEVGDLRVRFPGRRSGTHDACPVDGLSLSIDRGESLALVGESGSGKSLTALAIMGLLPPPGRVGETSTVLLNGRELTRLTESEYRRVRGGDIGLVFQDPGTSLNPLRSVNSQLIEAVRAHHSVSKPMASDIAVGLLHEVGFPEHRTGAYPHQLSGGMRQRVMIALALAGEPDLLIADEPTSALDVTVQAQILELLDHLREKRGMALLLITHDLSLVGGRTNRVAVMHAGRVVESGATEDIFAAPRHSYTRALFAAIPTLDGRSSLQWQGRVDRD